MNRQDSESANYTAQERRFPLISDVKTKDQWVGKGQIARTANQNQKSVTPRKSSRLDELISEDDIEWGE